MHPPLPSLERMPQCCTPGLCVQTTQQCFDIPTAATVHPLHKLASMTSSILAPSLQEARHGRNPEAQMAQQPVMLQPAHLTTSTPSSTTPPPQHLSPTRIHRDLPQFLKPPHLPGPPRPRHVGRKFTSSPGRHHHQPDINPCAPSDARSPHFHQRRIYEKISMRNEQMLQPVARPPSDPATPNPPRTNPMCTRDQDHPPNVMNV
jgi:hypothetical protein